ncbi:MAG: sodium:solute symporter family protein [Acidobacteria bacterium]|jgi:SSS family solute:Na+ symporter|nr:sodium:solute symporter family protein [Acidobacteriota bacterium]
MTIAGLHILDFAIVVAFVAVVLFLGWRASRKTKTTEDFYVAGRRLGKVYQFFLNLGTSTNADQAIVVSREVYRQGVGGMWIQYLVLFLTPFYWFTTAFFRRVRLVTIGDFFTERFKSRFLGGAFAVFTLFMAFLGNGVGYMVAAKTMMALTPKPAARYTVAERQSVDLFNEYRALQARADKVELAPAESARLTELGERQKKGELKAFISYTDSVSIYLIYTVIVAVYTMMGGFLAAAITDVIQGLLLTTFSLMLIPIALHRVGGFAGLHAAVPDYMFRLFGSAATSEYAWYTILAMVLANLVSIIAVATGMQTAGSAKNETTARVGMIGGMFFKRFIMIFWALTGLLAIALYSGKLHDPDLIWGHMTMDLLFPGAIGLMMAGVLSAKMSSLAGSSVSYSALFIRNLYQPFVKPKSDRHLINVGRVAIGVTLLGGVGVALFIGNLLDMFKYFISLPAIFGAAIWLGFLWRRVTRSAVIAQVFICFAIYALVPNVFQSLEWARTRPGFLRETRARTVTLTTQAVREDVEAGRATEVGQVIRKPHTNPPEGIFFEKVVRTDPTDPGSPKVGMGRFHAELWVLSAFGIDFSGASKAQLSAARFGFDALFPFVLLFLLSALTRPVPKADLDRFFARVHTPVQPTPEEEERALRRAVERYDEVVEARKLRPGSNWEIMKPKRADVLGFAGCWALVGVIILLLWAVVNIR